MNRRGFLFRGVATAAAALARPGWAAAGAPSFLTAANRADNSTWLVGLAGDGVVRFSLPLPARGHAAAAHPLRAEAVAFARRPGRFAVVIDCVTGSRIAELHSPDDRHFYGHGAFSADGKLLVTTENAFDIPDGRLGLWDAADGYRRIGEIASGGIQPHEIVRLPDGGFVVANGGVQTHPDYDRANLNVPTMRPNLTWLSPDGAIVEQVEPPAELHKASIRHVAADASGLVAMALQWEGDPRDAVPLAATARRGEALRLLDHPDTARLLQYGGSVAIAGDGSEFAVTGPKGGVILYFDAATGAPKGADSLPEASGVAREGGGLAITLAGGIGHRFAGRTEIRQIDGGWTWDNHLVCI